VEFFTKFGQAVRAEVTSRELGASEDGHELSTGDGGVEGDVVDEVAVVVLDEVAGSRELTEFDVSFGREFH
jgi:hypothetical protein